MFALFKSKNPYEQDARNIYAGILTSIRRPEFYTAYGVPDTLDGRFDLMVLHLFMVMDRVLAEGAIAKTFNQALFDITFSDMDQALRQAGIGDMGVPKHMRRMMKGFNGRVNAYQSSLTDDAALEGALLRNLYGTLAAPELGQVRAMKTYIQASRDLIKRQPFDELRAGQMNFAAL